MRHHHLTRSRGVILAITTCSLAALAGAPAALGGGAESADSWQPPTLTLTGVVRDFRERTDPQGHPDFEARPDAGFGHYMGNVATELDADGKPVFVGNGWRVNSQYHDAAGNPICYTLYDPDRGDSPGSHGSTDDGGISSAESFAQWFRDTPGVNASEALSLTLTLDEERGVYTFDDGDVELYEAVGGFFPINNRLFGNSAGDNKNFHFTFELRTEFRYAAGSGQQFTFRGDDDVWVYIDGRLVIDIGGVHSAVNQTVDLDRLDWLDDGEVYELAFFFAERHRTQSNFQIETSLNLRNAALPTSRFLYD